MIAGTCSRCATVRSSDRILSATSVDPAGSVNLATRSSFSRFHAATNSFNLLSPPNQVRPNSASRPPAKNTKQDERHAGHFERPSGHREQRAETIERPGGLCLPTRDEPANADLHATLPSYVRQSAVERGHWGQTGQTLALHSSQMNEKKKALTPAPPPPRSSYQQRDVTR